MTLIELLILLVIAGICGVIAEWIVGFSPGGFAVSIVVGMIGAFIGGYLANLIGLNPILTTADLIPQTTGEAVITRDLNFSIVYSILGSIVLLFIVSLVRGTGRRRRRGRLL